MMETPRPFASLSASLLARKGQARPAMRPFRETAEDDLGWNDMGHDEDVPVSPVHEQQVQLASEINRKPRAVASLKAVKPAMVEEVAVKAATIVAALPTGRKAAFTLRLDTERHLRLRLACAVTNRSAQQLLIEALDRLLNDIPELDALARQVPQTLSSRRR